MIAHFPITSQISILRGRGPAGIDRKTWRSGDLLRAVGDNVGYRPLYSIRASPSSLMRGRCTEYQILSTEVDNAKTNEQLVDLALQRNGKCKISLPRLQIQRFHRTIPEYLSSGLSAENFHSQALGCTGSTEVLMAARRERWEARRFLQNGRLSTVTTVPTVPRSFSSPSVSPLVERCSVFARLCGREFADLPGPDGLSFIVQNQHRNMEGKQDDS